jgi:dienelactone hydrolase
MRILQGRFHRIRVFLAEPVGGTALAERRKMFEYFPGNYVWSTAVNIALGNGAAMDEVDRACRPARDAASCGDDEKVQILIDSWLGVADRVNSMAERDAAQGRLISAGAKFRRACVYYSCAERMCAPGAEGRKTLYQKVLASFRRFMECTGVCERVEFPYGGSHLAALFMSADNASTAHPAPCVVEFDGFDIQKEIIFTTGMPEALARRGLSTLIVDQPGSGEALRLQNLRVEPKTEKPAAAAIDYLETRPEVDSRRIGMLAMSMGGYYAPRATAFEPRIRACVCWGGNYDWGEVQRMRYENSKAGRPIPHFWEHMKWALGADSIDQALAIADQINLRGILDRIRCPILITHGENDRQIALRYAQRTYDECVNSPKRELKIHAVEEGASEHCGTDNTSLAVDYIADWLAETLHGHNAPLGVRAEPGRPNREERSRDY